MEAKAALKYYRCSVRKVRQVLDLIRGKKVGQCFQILPGVNKKSARDIEKLLRSAVSNLSNREENKNVDPEEFFVKATWAGQGPYLKRFRPRAMGRAAPFTKKTCHVSILISN